MYNSKMWTILSAKLQNVDNICGRKGGPFSARNFSLKCGIWRVKRSTFYMKKVMKMWTFLHMEFPNVHIHISCAKSKNVFVNSTIWTFNVHNSKFTDYINLNLFLWQFLLFTQHIFGGILLAPNNFSNFT